MNQTRVSKGARENNLILNKYIRVSSPFILQRVSGLGPRLFHEELVKHFHKEML